MDRDDRIGELAAEGVLRAARAGAGWAFEQLYRDLSPVVAGYLRAQGAAEVEDLTSEVFLGVFRGLPGFVGDWAAFRSWVFTIAHRRLQDERRRTARRPSVPQAEPGAESSPAAIGGDAEGDALAVLGADWVWQICAELPPDQRDVLLLRMVGDLTVEQVATMVGKSTGAVKALQRRGLQRLRKAVVRQGVPL